MATAYGVLLSFNRGVISKTSLARTDLDRTRLSAEIMTNFLPKTQGPMILRPGTKYLGSSLNDTGAAWIEFVASVTQTALLELTNEKMRVWLPSDTGNTWETPVAAGLDVPMSRPNVLTTLSITDTGWDDLSSGGSVATQTASVIPQMTAQTTSRVEMTASSSTATAFGGRPWNAADRDNETMWRDTGPNNTGVPSWLNVDFDTGAVTGNFVAVKQYSIRAAHTAATLDNAPRAWRLITGNYDTGTYATDTGKWTLEDERSAQIDWSVSEKRTFTPAGADTGTIEARRHWRLYVTAVDTGNTAGDASRELNIAEVEMFSDSDITQQFVLNASAIGSVAKVQKRVVVDTGDRNIEHSLDIQVSRGPVTLRVGSSAGDDDYVSEADIGTGYHNLAFTPEGNFYVVLQSEEQVDRIVQNLTIGDSGTVELITPWAGEDLDNVRYDQSADVVYVDCLDVKPYKIERRGSGRSWSVVEYRPDNGPFLSARTSKAKLGIGAKYGNTQMFANQPFFRPSQEGSLFKITHEGQSGKWLLGAADAKTNVIEITGISDTGTPGTTNERRLTIAASGTYTGQITIERSFDGPDFGFKRVTADYVTTGSARDTGTFTTVIDDRDDNVTVFYRARVNSYTSGAATVNATYNNGSVTGTARVTSYVSNTEVDVEVLENFSDTGSSDSWREGAWSERRGYPTAVALHEGRLAHAGNANIWLSVSDDYENFDDEVEGESAPIARTLGSGPVNTVQYLLSLLRLIAGTTGSEIAIKASSLDETLTSTNSAAGAFSTQGSASLRAVKLDNKGLFVQRSQERLYMYGFGVSQAAANDYDSTELTILTPDILSSGVVSVSIQRQPDTRIHCVLANGTVAILTYEPQEEVLAWSKWVTDTGSNSAVERVVVLPGTEEDAVYYHIRRTINGVTKRFLEKWAMESECQGDTGLSWLVDCAVSNTDTGSSLTIADFAPHLAAQTIAAWANDTGQGNSFGRDLTPDDTGGDQQLLSLDTGGDLTLNDSGPKHVVGGLPYPADFKSTKLAYGAQGSTAMTMKKRIDRLALVLHQTHNNALFVGSDTGHLDPMPRVTAEGATVDANKIYTEYDKSAFPFDGDWDEDSRLYIRGKAPRPATVMAALPRVTTNES
jgi:hypothetical protein